MTTVCLQGAPAGPTSDAFDYGKEMEGVVQRVMQAKASAPMGPPPGDMYACQVRYASSNETVLPYRHTTCGRNIYLPFKHVIYMLWFFSVGVRSSNISSIPVFSIWVQNPLMFD